MLSWKQYMGIQAVLAFAVFLLPVVCLTGFAHWHSAKVTGQRLDAVTRAHSLAVANRIIAEVDRQKPSGEFHPISSGYLPMSTRVVAARDGKEQVLFEHKREASSIPLLKVALEENMVEQFHLEDWAGNDRQTRVSVDLESLPMASAFSGSSGLIMSLSKLLALMLGFLIASFFFRRIGRPRRKPKRWAVVLVFLAVIPMAYSWQSSVRKNNSDRQMSSDLRLQTVSDLLAGYLGDRVPEAMTASEVERIEQVCLQAGVYAKATSPWEGVSEFGKVAGQSAVPADGKLITESSNKRRKVEIWRQPEAMQWAGPASAILFALLISLLLLLFWPLFERLEQDSKEYWEGRDAKYGKHKRRLLS